MRDRIGLWWLVLQGVLYVLGASIYAVHLLTILDAAAHGDKAQQARVPEKWHPGRYDLWCSSHQIFHILVVIAAISHLTGLIKAFDHRHGLPCKSILPRSIDTLPLTA